MGCATTQLASGYHDHRPANLFWEQALPCTSTTPSLLGEGEIPSGDEENRTPVQKSQNVSSLHACLV